MAPVALIVVYYANRFGYGPGALLWQAVLLLAGHGVSAAAAIVWSVVLGCLLVVVVLSTLAVSGSRPEVVDVTVRGPLTYAGPGSLGGTESALRRASR